METAAMVKPSSSKKLKIAAITSFCLGVILLATGWLMGASFALYVASTGIEFPSKHSFSLGSNLEFTSINITSNIADIEITSTNSVFSASLVTYFNDVYFSYSVERGTLFITIEKDTNLLLPVGFSSIESLLTVNIPNGMALDRFVINNFSNNTLIEGINTSELLVTSTTGNISIFSVNSTWGSIFLTHGNGAFYDVTFELLEFGAIYGNGTFTNSMFDEIIAGSSNQGSFSLYNIHADIFSINTRYGYIMANGISTNSLSVRNVFGDISLSGSLNGRTEVSNNHGNITLYIQGSEAEFGFNLSTQGNVFINNELVARTLADRPTNDHLRIINRIGNIMVTFLNDL